ncbi:MAG: nucleoside diphosphate kinase regulator [Xanthobacteraceae bacterium]|nr:nucleoside diphosphate kinase regulator [Xanthobacteraceae bacterium]
MSEERKTKTVSGEIRPRITLTANDYERLSLLARAAASRMPDVASVLTEELARARVLAERRLEQTVCMGSEVEFRDDTTGKIQTVTLVYPGDADISQRRISVLTPVGTALIGLSAGDSITWETRSGDVKRLTVLQVGELRLA